MKFILIICSYRENPYLKFSYDMKQFDYAADLIRLGYTAETFKKDATGVVRWKRDKNQQPPFSLQYFIKRKQSQGRPRKIKQPWILLGM